MLTQNEILRMLVGLKEVNDLDLLDDAAVLNGRFSESNKSTVRAMATIIDRIYDDFAYETSPEFLQKIDGKSEQVQSMQRKLLDTNKLKRAKKRLGESITAILDSDDAFRLVAVADHHRLEELRRLAQSLSEPS